MHQELKEPLKIYIDSNPEPIKVSQPPLRFLLPTIGLPDGPHVLRVEAPNGLAPPTIKEIPFCVRNGVAVSVSGLQPGQTIGGQVDLIVNAYAGSTELNFEPKRAETPEPIPTWAWVLLLAVGAWTLSYVLTPPSSKPPEVPHVVPTAGVGERVFSDTCARCHGEDGNGKSPTVPALRDARRAVAESPYDLLSFVVTSAQPSMMPAWGTRLTNEELVAVVNWIRTSWRHDSSTIELDHRSPPQGPFRTLEKDGKQVLKPDGEPVEADHGIRWLENEMLKALQKKDAEVLGQCCYPVGTTPILFRTDGVRAKGTAEVSKAWEDYFADLGKGEVLKLQLIDARYDYDEAQVLGGKPAPNARVIGMGRVFLETKNAAGRTEIAKGRFIRVYEFFQGNWTLIFDFADIPMNVGCGLDEAELPCPPEEAAVELPRRANDLGFAEAQQLIRGLKVSGGSAPHGAFWKDLSYEEFVTGTFPDFEEPTSTYRIVQPWNAKESNLYRALKDGRGCLLKKSDGTIVRKDVDRMPKGRKPMAADDVERIAAWIDAGCPRTLGEASTLPKETVEFPPEAAAPAGGDDPPAPPSTPPNRDKPPAPPATAPTPAPEGPPKPAPTPPGKEVAGPVIGYAEVQTMLGSWLKSVASAPHQDFWTLSYDEFLKFEFPRTEGEDGTIRLLVVGDSAKSNLIKALRDGKGIVVKFSDGREETQDIKRMPPRGKKKPTDEELEKLSKWIDAGAPEQGRP
jgi:mono/diheme cytochrome c family protein